MGGRLDKKRQERLEPLRMAGAVRELRHMGAEIVRQNNTTVVFSYYGLTITFYPYSGWHTGRGIEDGRGFGPLREKLLRYREESGR